MNDESPAFDEIAPALTADQIKNIQEYIKEHGSIIPPRESNTSPKIETEVKIAIKQSGGFILVKFDPPQSIMKMDKKTARDFARRIVKEAL